MKENGDIKITDYGIGNFDQSVNITVENRTRRYEAYWKHYDKYKGIIVILDTDSEEELPDIACNIVPCATSHSYSYSDDYLTAPIEPYEIDHTIDSYNLLGKFKGNYLGNIIINNFNSDSKKAYFVSQESKETQIYRYYKFLDLTGTDILVDLDYDTDYEHFLEDPSEESPIIMQSELSCKLKTMSSMPDFAVILHENGDEELIDYKGKGVTEEGIREFEEFQRNVLNILKQGYELLQIPYKPTKSRNIRNQSRAIELSEGFRIATDEIIKKE